MESNRRGFLGLLASAPLAARAVADQAAAKMGLSTAFDTSNAVYGQSMGVPMPARADGGSWVRQALADMMTDRSRQQRRDQAREEARVLDPDLASMRSLSPSAAYAIQRKRSYQRITDRERKYLNWQLEDVARGEMPF